MWYKAFLIASSAAILLLSFYLYTSPEAVKTIQIVVPDNYIGPIEISEDAQNGASATTRAGVVTIEIGDAGTISLKSIRHFLAWHKLRFKTYGGSNIMLHGPVEPAQLSDDLKYAFSFGTESINGGPERIIYFIGTTNDANTYTLKRHPH